MTHVMLPVRPLLEDTPRAALWIPPLLTRLRTRRRRRPSLYSFTLRMLAVPPRFRQSRFVMSVAERETSHIPTLSGGLGVFASLGEESTSGNGFASRAASDDVTDDDTDDDTDDAGAEEAEALDLSASPRARSRRLSSRSARSLSTEAVRESRCGALRA